MQDNYIEKMAREYAEMLKMHDKKSTQSIAVPSEKRETFLEQSLSQLRAVAYLKSIVKNPVKKRVLLTIEQELSSLFDTAPIVKKSPFKSAENAIYSLIDKELNKLDCLAHFDIGENYVQKKYFVLTLISLLTF